MEREFVQWLTDTLPASPLLKIGLGDDAAVLDWSEGDDLVAATDAVTDRVDFHLETIDPRRAGHKALAVNLSDLAAMAAEPVAALVSLVLPERGCGNRSARELAEALYRGMLPLAEQFGCVIAGGDTNLWDGPLAVSVTVLGRVGDAGPLTRSGARSGDAILVTGALGGSILGRHLDVQPRVREGLALKARYAATAAIDISDGLALDASRLATASGCGVALDLNTLPVSPDAERLGQQTGRSPLQHALGDGEDFELLFSAPVEAAERMLQVQPFDVPVTRIGQCVAEPGLWQINDRAEIKPLPPTGFLHGNK